MTNPISDTVLFLIGASGDYNSLSTWKYVSVAFYLALLAAGFYTAWRNWLEDASQRSFRNVGVFVMRVVTAGLWFEGTIWKLPLPLSGGFSYWLGQEDKFSAIGFQAAIVRDVLVPHVALLQSLVYFVEISFTISFTLGLAVRLSGLVAVLFTLQLWLGLYNDPTEWPWTYIAIAVAHGMFASFEAGRCLGLDSLLRVRDSAVVRGNGFWSNVYRLAS